ncbi:MAG: histidinol-phosphatase HisJ family protein [Candidatus Ornithospirochaeta sp.]
MKQNLHTHSTYSDGKNTLKELVEAAISQGFDSLGFSCHCYTGFPFDECGIKSRELEDRYIKEIFSLKEEYRDRIDLYCGLEVESRAQGTLESVADKRLEYTIGSVHWFWKGDVHYSIDNTPEEFEEAEEYFCGIRPLIEAYYNEVMRFASFSPYTITGHIDLVTKFVEKRGWDFEDSQWYRDVASSALEHVVSKGKAVEVNTGAISRGWRTTPYPSTFLLERLRDLNAPIVLTSDCHDSRCLDCGFRETAEVLSSLGFKELMYLENGRLKGEKIV